MIVVYLWFLWILTVLFDPWLCIIMYHKCWHYSLAGKRHWNINYKRRKSQVKSNQFYSLMQTIASAFSWKPFQSCSKKDNDTYRLDIQFYAYFITFDTSSLMYNFKFEITKAESICFPDVNLFWKIFTDFLTSTLLRAQNTTFLSKVWQRFFSNLVAFSENTNFNYLDPLVKQKWSQFRGLYLHINNIVILPNWSENWILIQFSHWSDSPESTRQMEWTLRAKVKNFFQKWKF